MGCMSVDGFSEEFLAMSSEDRRESMRDAHASRSDLDAEGQSVFDEVVGAMSERWGGRLPVSKVVDMRSEKKAG